MRLALTIAVGIHAALFGASAVFHIGQRLHIEIAVPRAPIEVEYLESSKILVSPSTPTMSDGGGEDVGRARVESSANARVSNSRGAEDIGRVSNSASRTASNTASTATPNTAPTIIPNTASRATPNAASTTTSISSSSGAATTEISNTPLGPDTETTPNSYMHMRGPDLGLAGESAERIVGATQHDLPAETRHSGKLENAPNGKAVIHDRVTTMTVERDGHAHFADKPDIDLKLKLPIPHIDVEGMRKDLGELITEWYADPYASTRFGRTADLPNHLIAAPGACDAWGSIWCDDPLAPGAEKRAREQGKGGGTAGVGGPADITAYLQRKYVGDPYASRKLKLLDDTRDERVERGATFRDQQLVRSAELIDRNIRRAAALTGRDRRIALFELWDECSEGDDAEGRAGQRARAQVIGWIRAHLPKGSPDAFTDDEIAELTARRASHQPFEPY